MDRQEQTTRLSSHSHFGQLFFLGPSEDKCTIDLKNFLNLCHQIGVPIADEKTMGPATALQFAGITLDTVSMEAHLPNDKLDKCREQLSSFYSRKNGTLKELQSLIGLLNFACSVVVPDMPFFAV